MPTATQIPVENLLSAGARRRSSGYGHGYHGQRLLSAPSLVGLGCGGVGVGGKGSTGGGVVRKGSEAGMMMVNASQAVARAKREEKQEARRRNRRRNGRRNRRRNNDGS